MIPGEAAPTRAQNDPAELSKAVNQNSEFTANQESLLHFDDEYWSFDFSSKGMGIKNLKLKKYFDRDKNPKSIGTTDGLLPFATTLSGRRQPLDFKINRVGESGFVGVAQVDGLKVTKTINVNSETYTFDTKVTVSGADDNFIGVQTFMSEPLQNKSGGGFLSLNRFDTQEFFISYGTEEDRELIISEEPKNNNYSGVASVSVGEQYFAQALIDQSDVLPDAKTKVDINEGLALATVDYPFVNKNKDFNVSYVAYMGPKSFSVLEQVNSSLSSIIDFGWFSFLAKPILSLLKLVHEVFENWGVSIIILTILVRLVILPLHMQSYKSMKNMSKVSPLIKEINQKYKDDVQTKNQKLMEVYKENKINPLGGCLPMLLQFPVFIALYQVLGNSIELYQAPFILWVDDLSMKDPYYVLPVLMGITMFIQMRITPSTMDEMQKKVMMVMPIMFSIFMLALPSGLTLYIFISGLFE
ncbi:MAG: membrane protein insertase YidC [Bdellovibrionales bacterium]